MEKPKTGTGWNLQASYSKLDERLFSRVSPKVWPNPNLILFNQDLASTLGLNLMDLKPVKLAQLFSGNLLPPASVPLAQAYAGHQFGHFTMLGDGRATIIGEQLTQGGKLFDLQLKGSGQTPYSRRGDGRATLSSMLREYVVSEAMHHLGIPTSRSLAVVTTGEKVLRDYTHEGAVLTRVSSSHIRVGTFEYAARFVPEVLQPLLDYAVHRHFPEIQDEQNKALGLIKRVMEEKISLVANWLRVGFVHGVMNTDNTTISGETIDYGPCAFLNSYNPSQVFSSIDLQGRYAFGNQPSIAYWNIGCLASALLPLVDKNQIIAIKKTTEVLENFEPVFRNEWKKMMMGKFGFEEENDEDNNLIDRFVIWMKQNKADYTNSFIALEMDEKWYSQFQEYRTESFKMIKSDWLARVQQNTGGIHAARKLMKASNPSYIPRNHIVEHVLLQASKNQNMQPFNELLHILQSPYQRTIIPNYSQIPPIDGDEGYQTYCGT